MKYSILISQAAYEDIKAASEWYENQRVGLSHDFELCLEGGYEDIKSNPSAYQARFKNVRVKYIKRFPYGIHYFIDENIIYVLAVLHTSKNPKTWTRRIK